jgi:hypothetical protein
MRSPTRLIRVIRGFLCKNGGGAEAPPTLGRVTYVSDVEGAARGRRPNIRDTTERVPLSQRWAKKISKKRPRAIDA